MSSIRQWLSRLHLTEHRLFLAGMILKGIDGLLEIICGATVIIMGAARIKYFLWLWTSDELAEEPGNIFAQKFAHIGGNLSRHSAAFIAIYLLAHGAVKLGLVVGMLKRWHWAYPTAEALIVGFIGYQCYRLAGGWSWILLFATCTDAAIVVLIHLEYKHLRRG